MNKKERILELINIVVNECYCPMELFMENVKNCGEQTFNQELKKCNSKEELIKLVNQYI